MLVQKINLISIGQQGKKNENKPAEVHQRLQ
jgi:hypothetical protein